MSAIATVGLTMIGLAIAAEGPSSPRSTGCDTQLPSEATEQSPLGRPIAGGLALLRGGFPLDLVGTILSNVNEWKDMKFAFNRTPQTAKLLDLIDRYNNERFAAQGGNDTPVAKRVKMVPFSMNPFSPNNPRPPASGQIVKLDFPAARDISDMSALHFDSQGKIEELIFNKLMDDAIRDLSFLPKHLKVLSLCQGFLTHFDTGKLQPGLERVILENNQISEMVIGPVPASLRKLSVEDNPLKQGITFKTPLPDGLRVYIPENVPLDLDGGQENYLTGVVWWESGRTITLVRPSDRHRQRVDH